MKILDGKKISQGILENLKKEIKRRRLKLKLAIILIGDNPISEIFIKLKKRACEFIGVDCELFKFPATISYSELEEKIKKIVEDPANSGILIQLPIPKKFNSQKILNLVSPEKDIDVLSEKSLGKFYGGTLSILPPVVGAVRYFLMKYKISPKGKNVVLVGAGKLVGFPLTLWLFKEKATVSVVNEFTKNISQITQKADIIVSGVGSPGIITGKIVRRGVIIIDAGSGWKKGKIAGDVDFKGVSKKASYISPIPGGVGPMTIACLLENLVKLTRHQYTN